MMEGAPQPRVGVDFGGNSLSAAPGAKPQRTMRALNPILQETLCFLHLLCLAKQLPQRDRHSPEVLAGGEGGSPDLEHPFSSCVTRLCLRSLLFKSWRRMGCRREWIAPRKLPHRQKPSSRPVSNRAAFF